MPDSLHATLLAGEWAALDPALRHAHADRPMRLVGRASVERGRGWLAGLGARLTRLPGAATELPLEVVLDREVVAPGAGPAAERWERRFGAHPAMTSRLTTRGGCLVESLGAASLEFRLSAHEGGIRWQAQRLRLFGLPMPASWCDGIAAAESAHEGRYRFDVRVQLPGIGLVVHYRGELDPAPETAAEQHPDVPRSTVVFDGVCVLCCAGVEWIIRHDPTRRWSFVAMQSPLGQRLMRANGLSPVDATSFLVFVEGRALQQSDGVLTIAADAGGAWRALARVARVLPRGWRDALYRWVARRRLHWFGRRDSCYLPSAADRVRFLDD